MIEDVNQLISLTPEEMEYLTNLLEKLTQSEEFQQDEKLRAILKNLWQTKRFREILF